MQTNIEIFFGLQFLFFVATPSIIACTRLLLQNKDGFGGLFRPIPPRSNNKFTVSARLRRFLFENTRIGMYLDNIQAGFSAISALLYIITAYMSSDVADFHEVELFFTLWFFVDYTTRLFIARDSMKFFFSLVSLLDYVTVVPAMVIWIMGDFFPSDSQIEVRTSE